MTRIEKDRWKLPDHERTRIENILKRALDVEKGVVEQPSVTEEHPDGCKYLESYNLVVINQLRVVFSILRRSKFQILSSFCSNYIFG